MQYRQKDEYRASRQAKRVSEQDQMHISTARKDTALSYKLFAIQHVRSQLLHDGDELGDDGWRARPHGGADIHESMSEWLMRLERTTVVERHDNDLPVVLLGQ